MQFDSGYLSPYFVTDHERMEVAFENAYILIHEKQIGSKQDLLPLLEQITKSGKPLVIIAVDVCGEALATLVVRNLHGPLQVAAVRTAGSGIRARERCGALPSSLVAGYHRRPRHPAKNVRFPTSSGAKITIGKNNTVVEVRTAFDSK